jgi:hypothetical protein
MNYVHKYVPGDRLWCVGWVGADGEWHVLRDCGSGDEAAAFLNYLNGGTGEPFDWLKP